jgi:membrane dipeptidase
LNIFSDIMRVADDSRQDLVPPSTASEIIAASDVWDMTVPWMPVYWEMDTLARFKRAGFTYVSLTLQEWPPTFDNTQLSIERFKELASAESAWLMFGNSLADIDRGRREGKLVLGINSQETLPIGDDLARIEALHALGVRHMLLAYNIRNLVADGCAERADAGLSNFGRQVVLEMNRVGILVDGSHTGRRSSLEAIDLSARPVIFSHSNAYSLCPHIRNIRDDQIRACAARGGVVGVVGVGSFLGDVEARAESVFRHIDYIASMVGPEHVGIGSDYGKSMPYKDYPSVWEAYSATHKSWPDPTNAWPDPTGSQIPLDESRCFQPEQLVDLVEIMLAHGYSVEVVKGILGGNFRRVYATVL